MAKKMDITEKLEFGENPVVVVNGQEFEVNSDAETILRLLGIMSGPRTLVKITESLELLFGAENLKKICTMTDEQGGKLKAGALLTILNQAVELVMGDDSGGEQ